jgi:hypothetical protein
MFSYRTSGNIEFIKHEDSINEALNQDDLNKLDISDYKIFDYLDSKDSKKIVAYYNMKLCKVFAMFPCDGLHKDKIDAFIKYSDQYFYEKFGPEIYISYDEGYRYSYENFDKRTSTHDDKSRYSSEHVFPTQRRIFMTNVYLKFEVSIFYLNGNNICVNLAYKTIDEVELLTR